MKSAVLGVGGMAMGGRLMARRKMAPDYMRIVKERMNSENYVSHYVEPEITEPVLLCLDDGRLNPKAIGWSRIPLVKANLKGHWLRKKRWNFWNWISDDFVFSVTLSDIDYASFCAVSFIDFISKDSVSTISIKPGGYIDMPEEVESSVFFESGLMKYSFDHKGDHIKVDYFCKNASGKPVVADFIIHKPKGHETLNIVVPWSDERFQMNSKHNSLPVEGFVKIGEKKYLMNPENCYGVQDFGRGIWPYRSYWNWGVATGKQDGNIIGVNFGAKWTTGTGINENGICFNGRLYKVMEDLIWEYDPNNWMKPWKVRADYSRMIDLTLTPFYEQKTRLSLGLLSTEGVCCFGKWNGIIRFDGKEVKIRGLIGWAEEFSHRW